MTTNQPKHRRNPAVWFDARSVMLFAALAVGGAAIQAQTLPTPTARTTSNSAPARTGSPTTTTTSPTTAPTTAPSTSNSNSKKPSDTLEEMKRKRHMYRGSGGNKAARK